MKTYKRILSTECELIVTTVDRRECKRYNLSQGIGSFRSLVKQEEKLTDKT